MLYICQHAMCTHPFISILAIGQPPKLPIQVQDIIMNYGVFWQYPHLIPDNGFCKWICVYMYMYMYYICIDPLDHPTSSKYFLPSEDGLELKRLFLRCSTVYVYRLLALGMDHYGVSAWKLIQQNLLPIKAPRQVSH